MKNTLHKKALKILGLIKYKLHDDAFETIKLFSQNTLCKTILEYASEGWDSSSKQLEQLIEAVGRKALRFIKKCC